MNAFDFKYVLCPFFKRLSRSGQTITCEGIPNSVSANIMLFETNGKMMRYWKERCCSNFKDCPVAKELYAKYEK